MTLKVYDVLGREVAMLVDEVKPAGEASIQWDASRFAGGVYLCKLRSGSFSAVRKLVLLR